MRIFGSPKPPEEPKQPTIISHRLPSGKAEFVVIDTLLESDDLTKIKEVYAGAFKSVTAYDPQHVESLQKAERRLYGRIKELERRSKTGEQNDETTQPSEVENIHNMFQGALDQMKQRSLPKEACSSPEMLEKLNELKSRRLSNPQQELARLKENPRILKSLDEVTNNKVAYKRLNLTIEQQIAFGHSLELQEALKDTHYVFNHGQCLQLMFLNIITRLFKQEFEPQLYERFEPLRHEISFKDLQPDMHDDLAPCLGPNLTRRSCF